MAHGWTEERRARQAELIRTWKPWEKSTGPRTSAGKRKAAKNAAKSWPRQIAAIKKMFRQALGAEAKPVD
jgi:hypothetical protein